MIGLCSNGPHVFIVTVLVIFVLLAFVIVIDVLSCGCSNLCENRESCHRMCTLWPVGYVVVCSW